jgi:tetratricopeptide (TPR) repeat protein
MTDDTLEAASQEARQAVAARDWNRAKLAYLRAVGIRPDEPDMHYGLAAVFFQLGELTSAAFHFREVARLDPRRAAAYINLGAVLNQLTQYDEAVAALRKGIQLDPKRAEGYYNLGLVYRHKKQPELAIQSYREAIRVNPKMADAHLNLANLFCDKEQYRQAVQHYEAALQLRPGWQKAEEGLALAKAGLAGKPAAAAPTPEATTEQELHKVMDPTVHGDFLEALFENANQAEEIGRRLQGVLGSEVESALKELSLSLLQSSARHSLEASLAAFEEVLGKVQKAEADMKANVAKLRELEAQFTNLPVVERMAEGEVEEPDY